jgi:hypothetical protein
MPKTRRQFSDAGLATTNSYNILDRLSGALHHDGTRTTNSYDALSRATAVWNETTLVTTVYDPLSRKYSPSNLLLSEQSQSGLTTYSSDPTSNPDAIDTASGRTTSCGTAITDWSGCRTPTAAASSWRRNEAPPRGDAGGWPSHHY